MAKKAHFWHFITSLVFIVIIILLTIAFHSKPLSISTFTFILLILAAFRLTHLFVYDTAMDFTRDYFDKSQTGFGKSMSELIHCPWCTSTWMALIILTLYFITPYSMFLILVLALAGASVVIEIVARLIWKKIPN